ncbi:glycoside hydrolase family 15 protein [Candidatus Pacebacteria bacterium]|nr:glycoside hydrolase family 15 protein [Candidatus Paceibacterota bacterium]
MARAVTLGNGNMLVGLDYSGQVRDFYFPNVGHSNHVSGASGSFVHRIGIYVDGKLSWLDESSWKITMGCDSKTVVGSLYAVNDELGVSLSSVDAVHNEENIFIRSFIIGNEKKESRKIKIFFSQQFRISESRRGDTGFYDPRVGAIIHYKGHVKLLINAMQGDQQFTNYNIGLFGIEGLEGAYCDALDGELEGNSIEHGSVDSIIGITCDIAPNEHAEVQYWVACATTIDGVHDLNSLVLKETPEVLIASTQNYWKAWIGIYDHDQSLLSPELRVLYRRSLTIIRVHTNNNGGIIASSDTDMLHHGRDTYGYVWPRDASIIANALDRAGHHDIAKQYFTFMTDKLERGGYLMHKYRVDGVLGSSWHSWIQHGEKHLPIQEDETALTLLMLWKHYEAAHDVEFVESLYNSFIEPAAEFLTSYMEAPLGLPDNSYDLWEEKYGIHTYTACSVYAALNAAAHFATLFGKQEVARTNLAVAQRIRSSILEHLYDEELGMFVKRIRLDEHDEIEVDKTLDMSSFFGPIIFGVLEAGDERITRCFRTVEKNLKVDSASKGYVRYQGDSYYTMQDAGSPNPWVITTLWMAQYHIMKAEKLKDLEEAYKILEWTCSHATKSGVLAEQMHPHTREHLSTAPLTWSHAEFVITVDEYLKKYEELTGSKFS